MNLWIWLAIYIILSFLFLKLLGSSFIEKDIPKDFRSVLLCLFIGICSGSVGYKISSLILGTAVSISRWVPALLCGIVVSCIVFFVLFFIASKLFADK